MSIPKSPFAASSSNPGVGDVVLSLLPPGKQVLTSFVYQYPLKLIAPDPHHAHGDKHVTVVFLLTYGGGLVGGDKIDLRVELQTDTKMVLVTQGSTKIFKSPDRSVVSAQTLNVKIGAGSSLCYLPDPTQPFAESMYEQKQTFYIDPKGSSSLLLLDWVSEGRPARGESWTLWSWRGRNEVRDFDEASKGRLLLRDAVMLGGDHLEKVSLSDKTNGMGIFGTLIIYGPIFKHLADFFMQEFSNLPRIGAVSWSKDEQNEENAHSKPPARTAGDRIPQRAGLLWTAANVRGFVLVKFGARQVDDARQWLGGMLRREGTVEAHFGQQALIGLR